MTLEFTSEKPIGDSELFIYLDAEGRAVLQKALDHAHSSGHDHLMSEAWGGRELTISNADGSSYNKVTITFAG